MQVRRYTEGTMVVEDRVLNVLLSNYTWRCLFDGRISNDLSQANSREKRTRL